MSAAAGRAERVWTQADLQSMPDDRRHDEAENGELAVSPRNNFQHDLVWLVYPDGRPVAESFLVADG